MVGPPWLLMPTDTGPSGEVSAERTSVSEVEEKQVGHTLIDNVVANFDTRPRMHKAMCLPSAPNPKLTRYKEYYFFHIGRPYRKKLLENRGNLTMILNVYETYCLILLDQLRPNHNVIFERNWIR